MAVDKGTLDRVLGNIDRDELIQLALDLANIDSPTGEEGAVADYIYEWLSAQGMKPRKVALMPNRPNIVCTLPGAGDGYSLLLNSHMDTTIAKEEIWTQPNAADPIYHTGRREGEYLIGNGICNNKGPMATWMIAAKALHKAGVQLRGDLVLTMVPGEIGLEPVDEFTGDQGYVAKEAGARYAVTRGAVADYALVAEGTNFGVGWVEAGKAFFKLNIFGSGLPIYTPHLERPHTIEDSPNAIVRTGKLILALEEWAYDYERRNTYDCPGGTCVPRVQIGAIRGGTPYKITKSVGICTLYLDVRITPKQDALEVRRELRDLLQKLNLKGEVELYTFRPGYEGKNVERLTESIALAHQAEFGERPKKADVPYVSMWRDCNVFNEVGIPSVIYGPAGSVGGGTFAMKISDMEKASRIYAQIALDLCNQIKPVGAALAGVH